MARFSLIPRDARYFDFFEQAGANLVEVARAVQALLEEYTEVEAKLAHLRDLEHAGDRIVHDVMRALNRTFITPLDREDITALVHALDDVVDKSWAAAARLHIYQIPEPTGPARDLAGVLVQMAEALVEALPYLRQRGDMQRIIPVTERLDRLESEADDHLRAGLRSLFAYPTDPQEIVLGIKWREIYDLLEEATDKAEDAANVLEAIVLKHG
jgi:predicted phosphate transport protein (TIGR00153 family)